MKRTLLYVWLAMVSFLNATAREIAPTEALQNALMALEDDAEAKEILQNGADLHLMYTQKSGEKTLFYVFETTEGGFLVASANDNANAVLGYTGNGTFREALAIPSFKSWVGDCTKALTFVANQPEASFKDDHNRQGSFRSKARRANLPEKISPLLETIAWNQGAPYNRLCPLVQGTRCATGCVATAMAMVMKYWEWPIHGTGEVSYTSSTYNLELSADFSQSTYEWKSMLNRYDGTYTDVEAVAVAKLMSDVGISVRMNYGPSSGTSAKRVPLALANNFFYNKGVKYLERCYFDTEEWNSIIKGELSESRPVLMTGFNYMEFVGHEFVLDGYNANGLYHVNWGWGGTSNGYFDVNFMSPDYQGIGGSNGGYVAEQIILTDLYPDREGNSEYAINMFCKSGLAFDEKKGFTMELQNNSMIPYEGELGIIAEKDGVIISKVMDSCSGNYAIPSMDQRGYFYKLDELGLTASQIGEGNKCYVYPAYKDAKGNYVKVLAPVYKNDRMAISSKGGALAVDSPNDNVAKLSQVSLALDGLAFPGYPIYFKVQVKNEEGAGEFNNLIGVEISNSKGTALGAGYDCKIIPGGSSADFYIKVEPRTLSAGSYRANIIYGFNDDYDKLSTKHTTFVVNPAPASARLAYSNAVFFGNRVEEGAPVDITMDVTNTGGYTEHEFAAYLFPNSGSGEVYSVGVLGPVSCRITANKKNQIKISGIMDLQPGSYFCQIRDNTIGAWVPSGTKHSFTVTESVTGVGCSYGVYESSGTSGSYDLSGRKVQNPSKGVYIINGKKVVY
jgi:hypothetical protein